MAESFQEQIDEALRGVPRSSETRVGEVHAPPLQEAVQRSATIAKLVERGVPNQHDCLHMGIAGFFNFDIAAVTRPDYLLLLDINTQQHAFWREVISMLKKHETPQQFYSDLHARVGREQGYFFCDNGQKLELRDSSDDCLFYVHNALWMKDQSAYDHIRRLANDGRIATAEIDLVKDEARATALASALRSGPYETDTCYWSNLATFLVPRGGARAPKNYRELIEQRFGINDHTVPNPSYSLDGASSFEKFLHHVSLIGGEKGMHILCGTVPNQPLTITEGPPSPLGSLASERSM